MSLEYRIGDVFDRLREIPDGSIDLVVSSPPFLALRSYLPADHPDKHKEIGSEATPADFIDTLLALTAEFDRVLAPHGSICIELGDTFAGSGGAGGDYNANGMREGQPTWKQTTATAKTTAGNTPTTSAMNAAAADTPPTNTPAATATNRGLERATTYDGGASDHHDFAKPGTKSRAASGTGWPLAKSLTGIPTLYTWCLAYGRNLLTGQPSPAGQWRIRNVIVWARPNPPVGALGDKFRPATSYITVACKGAKRYFDLDAVRGPYSPNTNARTATGVTSRPNDTKTSPDGNRGTLAIINNDGAGAPPLDWHADNHPEDGDWLWKLPTQPYAGSHYATFPMALPKRLIEAMCPQRVCSTCGVPSTRIVDAVRTLGDVVPESNRKRLDDARDIGTAWLKNPTESSYMTTGGSTERTTIGWTDCGHDAWRVGVTLDPFAGSGTTLEAAQAVGRHAIGIDLDQRNATLAQARVGMFMEVVEDARTETDTTSATLLEVRSEGGG